MNKWQIVHDCDGENGEPTCWTKEISHPDYGRFVWITENTNGKFDVEICEKEGTFRILATCKSLASAKIWISMNINY